VNGGDGSLGVDLNLASGFRLRYVLGPIRCFFDELSMAQPMKYNGRATSTRPKDQYSVKYCFTSYTLGLHELQDASLVYVTVNVVDHLFFHSVCVCVHCYVRLLWI
jgi:hypothetical protein